MRASASRTEISRSDIDAVVRRILDPSLPPPARFEPSAKQPGSKELILGRWVEVVDGESPHD